MKIGPGVQTGLTLLGICIFVVFLSIMLMLIASADAFNGKVATAWLEDICEIFTFGAIVAFIGTGVAAIMAANNSEEEDDDGD